MTDLERQLERRFPNENDLTISLLLRAIEHFNITDVSLWDEVYETVIFWSHDHDPNHGWGSSDTGIVLRAVEERLNVVHGQSS